MASEDPGGGGGVVDYFLFFKEGRGGWGRRSSLLSEIINIPDLSIL